MRSGSFTTTHTHDYPDKTVEFVLDVEWSATEGDPPGPWCNQWEPPEAPEIDECNACVIAVYIETDELGRVPVPESELDGFRVMFDALCAADPKITARLLDSIYETLSDWSE